MANTPFLNLFKPTDQDQALVTDIFSREHPNHRSEISLAEFPVREDCPPHIVFKIIIDVRMILDSCWKQRFVQQSAVSEFHILSDHHCILAPLIRIIVLFLAVKP